MDFSTLDYIDEASSFLTTFSAPFGRYLWKRMPFGICSVPEVFQRKMSDLIEGLRGIEREFEVIADHFLVVGFGDNLNIEQATKNHDEHLLAFIQRCEELNIILIHGNILLAADRGPFHWTCGHRTWFGSGPGQSQA